MDVQNVMEQMQQRNREMFKVPPYILYVARAFSTLEGIGLSANEDYSIVSEAYPYLSKRLLTDESPRAKAALRSMLYGSEDRDASNATPDFGKMLSMGQGFASYSTATSAVPDGAASPAPAAAAAAIATPAPPPPTPTTATAAAGAAGGAGAEAEAQDALIDLLISADGNYVQVRERAPPHSRGQIPSLALSPSPNSRLPSVALLGAAARRGCQACGRRRA